MDDGPSHVVFPKHDKCPSIPVTELYRQENRGNHIVTGTQLVDFCESLSFSLYIYNYIYIYIYYSLFDETMGSYDGAEICELVGIYILNILANKYDKNNIGLYRDDGLVAELGLITET